MTEKENQLSSNEFNQGIVRTIAKEMRRRYNAQRFDEPDDFYTDIFRKDRRIEYLHQRCNTKTPFSLPIDFSVIDEKQAKAWVLS